MKIKFFQRGIALYISLIMMAFLLAAGLGLTVIIVSQLRMGRDIGNSLKSFYAADTGIENAIYNRRIGYPENRSFWSIGSTDLTNSPYIAQYSVNYDEVQGVSESWDAVGVYGQESRAIRIEQRNVIDFSFYEKTHEISFCVQKHAYSPTYLLYAVLLTGPEEDVTFSYDPLPPEACIDFLEFDPESGTLVKAGLEAELIFYSASCASYPIGEKFPITIRATTESGKIKEIDGTIETEDGC